MFVARLRLVNFRSYDDVTVEFDPGLNVIVGPNASGKTNLLEGAFFALRAGSPRTTKEEKAVRWGATYTRAEAIVAGRRLTDSHSLTVAYAPGQGKQVRVDGVEVSSLDDLRRQGSVFIFVPESLLLVKGSPARRRAHLDAFAAALEPAYDAGLRDLNVVLKQRNAHLWRVREGAPADSLDAWDRQLARVALAFAERRRTLVERLAARYGEFAGALAPGGGEFSLSLVSQLDGLEAEAGLTLPGSLEDAFVAALRARRPGEIGRAISGFGPHRDDLRFAEESSAAPLVGGPRDLRLFGSQGEQRAAVLALLLAERAVAAEVTGDLGTLLLDDVMSELDDARRRLLVGTLTAGGQALITTTNRLYFTAAELARARVLDIGARRAADATSAGASEEASGEVLGEAPEGAPDSPARGSSDELPGDEAPVAGEAPDG